MKRREPWDDHHESERPLRLVVIRGLPASGKTTLAKKIAEGRDETDAEYAIHSIRDHVGGVGRDCDQRRCHRESVAESLRGGRNVVVPSNFPCRWRMQGLREIAAVNGVKFEVVDHFDGGCTDEELASRSLWGATVDEVRAVRAHYEPEDDDQREARRASLSAPPFDSGSARSWALSEGEGAAS